MLIFAWIAFITVTLLLYKYSVSYMQEHGSVMCFKLFLNCVCHTDITQDKLGAHSVKIDCAALGVLGRQTDTSRSA